MSKITRQGYEELLKKRQRLIEDLKKYQIELIRAREEGDLRENADYHATKSKITDIKKELELLDVTIGSAIIIEQTGGSETIHFGSRFIVEMHCATNRMFNGTKEFVIVGQQEANFSLGLIDEKGLLGKELIGKKPGDTIHMNNNTIDIQIKEILH